MDWARRGSFAVIALFAVISLATFESVYEDGYIYFRAAAHIARGHGYVFNVGGEHIETGSSVLWQLLLSLFSLLSMNMVLSMKLMGLGFASGTLHLLFLTARKLIATPALQVLPSLLLAVAFPFYVGAQRGLETPLYAFAVVLLAHVLLDERLKDRWHLAALLVVFSRSEGFVTLAGLLGFLVVERRNLRPHLERLGIVLGCLTASYVGRYFYFHDLVPHPFYMKILFPNGLAFQSTQAYFRETWTWVPLAVGAIGLAHRRTWDGAVLVLSVYGLPFLWWASWAGGSMAQFNQHITPVLPVLFLLMARGMDQLVSSVVLLRYPVLAGGAAFAAWSTWWAPALGLGVHPIENLFVTGLRRVKEKPEVYFPNIVGILTGRTPRVLRENPFATDAVGVNWQAQVGDFIRRTYPKGITVLYDQMGQTPWYAGLDKTFIDSTGLTYRATGFAQFNASLPTAHSALFGVYKELSLKLLGPFHETSRTWTREEAVDHLFELRPHLIIINRFNMPKARPDGTIEVIHDNIAGLVAGDPRLEERYVRKLKPWLSFFERKDIADSIHWEPGDHDVAGKAARPAR